MAAIEELHEEPTVVDTWSQTKINLVSRYQDTGNTNYLTLSNLLNQDLRNPVIQAEIQKMSEVLDFTMPALPSAYKRENRTVSNETNQVEVKKADQSTIFNKAFKDLGKLGLYANNPMHLQVLYNTALRKPVKSAGDKKLIELIQGLA